MNQHLESQGILSPQEKAASEGGGRWVCVAAGDRLAKANARPASFLSEIRAVHDLVMSRDNWGCMYEELSGVTGHLPIQVISTTLDDEIDREVALIKLDIEGAEYEARRRSRAASQYAGDRV